MGQINERDMIIPGASCPTGQVGVFSGFSGGNVCVDKPFLDAWTRRANGENVDLPPANTRGELPRRNDRAQVSEEAGKTESVSQSVRNLMGGLASAFSF